MVTPAAQITTTTAAPPLLQPHAAPRAVRYENTFNLDAHTAATGQPSDANVTLPASEQPKASEQIGELLEMMREMRFEMQDVRKELVQIKQDR
jgi:hypothetical protein